MNKGFVCGVFDMYHAGHVLMLKECKEHCDYLIVALNRAENISSIINPDKQGQIYTLEERKLIMTSCSYVDEVFVYNSEKELLQLMGTLNLNIRFLGDDYRGKKITGEELNIPIFYTDRSHGLSTSKYKEKLFNLMNKQSLRKQWNIDSSWTLFLDRDGVINREQEGEYIKNKESFFFLKGVLESLKILSKIFPRIIVVTNQQGVGKGLMSEFDLKEVNAYMLEEVKKAGGRIDAIYCATELNNESSRTRKPNRTMADWAQKDFPEIDFEKSVMVGNSVSDMKFGTRLSMKTVFVGIEQRSSVNLHSFTKILQLDKEEG